MNYEYVINESQGKIKRNGMISSTIVYYNSFVYETITLHIINYK